MNDISAHIDNKIKRAENKTAFYGEGNTADIVKNILKTHVKYFRDTKAIAPLFKGKDITETCRNIWKFLKEKIKFMPDALGVQYIKAPARLYKDKSGDCKSFSIFTASILQNLGIDYIFRFTNYDNTKEVKHVYIVAFNEKNEPVYIDAVYSEFNKEKNYSLKKDFMTKIYRVTGLSGFELDNISPLDLTKGQLDLLLAKDRILTEKSLIEEIKGVGLMSDKYSATLKVIQDALDVMKSDRPNKQQALKEILIRDQAGLYGVGVTQPKTVDKNAPVKDSKLKTMFEGLTDEKVIKKSDIIAKDKKEAEKGIKEVFEKHIPELAPIFLYLFLNPDRLNPLARDKRKQAEIIAEDICQTYGITRAQILAFARNSIMKKYKQSPEQLLISIIRDKKNYSVSGVEGVGFLGFLIKPALKLIGKIGGTIFKPKPGGTLAGNLIRKLTGGTAPIPAPAPSDFTELQPQYQQAPQQMFQYPQMYQAPVVEQQRSVRWS